MKCFLPTEILGPWVPTSQWYKCQAALDEAGLSEKARGSIHWDWYGGRRNLNDEQLPVVSFAEWVWMYSTFLAHDLCQL